jgi:hypothetical protein
MAKKSCFSSQHEQPNVELRKGLVTGEINVLVPKDPRYKGLEKFVHFRVLTTQHWSRGAGLRLMIRGKYYYEPKTGFAHQTVLDNIFKAAVENKKETEERNSKYAMEDRCVNEYIELRDSLSVKPVPFDFGVEISPAGESILSLDQIKGDVGLFRRIIEAVLAVDGVQ